MGIDSTINLIEADAFQLLLHWNLWCSVYVFLVWSGPSIWHQNFPVAQGDRQSPIDIIPQEAPHDPDLGPIVLNYDHCTSLSICNNGHSVVVEFDDTDDRSGEKFQVLTREIKSSFII